MNREMFFEKITMLFTPAERRRIRNAYALAKVVHRFDADDSTQPQLRDSGERYFEHCRRTALILLEYGTKNANVIIAGFLHDVFEDTYTPPDLVEDAFGEKLTAALLVLSKQIPTFNEATGDISKEQKSDGAYFAGIATAKRWIRLVKLADRLDNLQTIDLDYWNRKRIARYIKETETLILPIAKETSADFTEALGRECMRLQDLLRT